MKKGVRNNLCLPPLHESPNLPMDLTSQQMQPPQPPRRGQAPSYNSTCSSYTEATISVQSYNPNSPTRLLPNPGRPCRLPDRHSSRPTYHSFICLQTTSRSCVFPTLTTPSSAHSRLLPLPLPIPSAAHSLRCPFPPLRLPLHSTPLRLPFRCAFLRRCCPSSAAAAHSIPLLPFLRRFLLPFPFRCPSSAAAAHSTSTPLRLPFPPLPIPPPTLPIPSAASSRLLPLPTLTTSRLLPLQTFLCFPDSYHSFICLQAPTASSRLLPCSSSCSYKYSCTEESVFASECSKSSSLSSSTSWERSQGVTYVSSDTISTHLFTHVS